MIHGVPGERSAGCMGLRMYEAQDMWGVGCMEHMLYMGRGMYGAQDIWGVGCTELMIYMGRRMCGAQNT